MSWTGERAVRCRSRRQLQHLRVVGAVLRILKNVWELLVYFCQHLRELIFRKLQELVGQRARHGAQ